MGMNVCFFIMIGSFLPVMVLGLWAIYWKRYKPFLWLIPFTWTDLQLGQAYIAFYRKQFMLMWFYLLGWAGLVVYSYILYRRLIREKNL